LKRREESGRLHYIAGIPYLSGNQIQLQPPGRLERLLRWSAARSPVQAAAYVFLLLVLVCGGGWVIDQLIALLAG